MNKKIKSDLYKWIVLLFVTLLSYNNCSRFKSGPLTSDTQNPQGINDLASNTPIPVDGDVVSYIDLVSKENGTQYFTTGIAFKKGDLPGEAYLNLPSSQFIVKRRWNDGSVKHAILSGQINLTANIPVRVSIIKGLNLSVTSASGPKPSLTVIDIETAQPQAVVQLGTLGSVELKTLLSKPHRVFIAGSEMIEAHYRSSVAGSPNMMVWFQVRVFRGGSYWVRTIVENGLVDDTMSDVTYLPQVTIASKLVFNNGAVSLKHFAHTRWMAEGWSVANANLSYKYDLGYLNKTKLVPNYWRKDPTPTTLTSLNNNYLPLKNGALTPNMGETGFQEQIGILPKWDSLFVTSGDERAFQSVLVNSSSLNSYPILWRDQNHYTIPKPTDWPSWAIDGGVFAVSTSGGLTWELSHAPSEGYLAYLLTGDYWHLETMAMQVATIYLSRSSATGTGLNKILLSQTRGTAWNLRTLSQFTAIAPKDGDFDDILNEYQSLLANQMTYFKSLKDTPNVNQLGYLYEYDLSAYSDIGAIAPWQQHFLIQSLGFGSDIESLTDMTVWNEIRDWSYKAIVGILGDGVGGNFCYTKASSYNILISSTANSNPSSWFKTWSQVWSSTFPGAGACGKSLEGDSGGDPAVASTGYWGNLLPALAYAVDHRAPGASEAFQRLQLATNWNLFAQSGFENTPNWGIVPRGFEAPSPTSTVGVPSVIESPVTSTPLPSDPLPGVITGSADLIIGWNDIPNTKLGAICAPDPSPTHSTSSDCVGVVLAWGGAIADTKRQRMVLFGGGHQDYDGNELYAYDLGSRKMLRLNDPTPLPSGASGTGTYADGRPASRHTYGGIAYTEHNDKMSVFGGSIPYLGNMLREVWVLDFSNFYLAPNSATPWKKLTDDIAAGVNYGGTPFSAYDPVSKLVYLIDSGNGTYSLNTDTNEIKVLNSSSAFSDYHFTMVVDPINRYVYAFGYNEVKRMSIAAGSTFTWSSIASSLGTSCSSLVGSGSPGIAYDSKNKKIVGWNGGTSTFMIDPLTLNCTTKNWGGINPGAQLDAGTFNRFSYFAAYNYFVLINDPNQNVRILKME